MADLHSRWMVLMVLAVLVTCTVAVAQDDDVGLLKFNEAVEHYEAGRLEQARDGFLAALQTRPDDPIVLCWLGSVAVRMNQPDEAIDYLTRAIAQDPEYAVSYNNLGNAYLAKNDLAQAEAQYLKATEKDSQYFDAFYNLANLHVRAANYEKAFNY
jgi:predicted Zn-dependent protease